MPLVLWPVQPIYLFRDNKVTDDNDALRAQRLHGITNILRQMSSISKNVEDIFTGISTDLASVQLRTKQISDRVEKLRNISKNAVTVESALDPELKEWAMNIKIGAPTVARNTLPEPIEKLYNSCVPMPQLEKLDKYSGDGSKCLSSYSKPEFFFEQWITSFDKDIALKQEKRAKKKEDKKAAAAAAAANRDRKGSVRSASSGVAKTSGAATVNDTRPSMSGIPESDDMQLFEDELGLTTDETGAINDKTAFEDIEPPSTDDSLLGVEPACITPPDIEPLELNDAAATTPAAPDSGTFKINEVKAAAPPPPPPPPPVCIMQVSTPAPAPPQLGTANLKSRPAPKPAAGDGRMDLLSSIRKGKELKSVKIEEKKEVEQYAGNDVASILARRINICGDSDSEASEEDDGDDWD